MTWRLAATYVLCAILVSGCNSHPSAPSSVEQRQGQSEPKPGELPQVQHDPAHPLSGSYALTLTLGETCGVLPQEERLRQYAATIEYRRSLNIYVVTLAGSFLSGPICTAGSGRFAGLDCNQFFAFDDVDRMEFWLLNNNDEAHGGHLVERLSSGGWMEVVASSVVGPLTASSTIETTGPADVWYCPTPSEYPFPCPGFVACKATELRLKVTRK